MKIVKDLCGLCELCIPLCDENLIVKKGFTIKILEGCTNCEKCLEVCPIGAIEPD